MRGFPKFLNTKQDYLNCLTMFLYAVKDKESVRTNCLNNIISSSLESLGIGINDNSSECLLIKTIKSLSAFFSPTTFI